MDLSEFPPGYSYPKEMRGLYSSKIAEEMKSGWNLGNSLEAEKNETYWGNPKTTKVMIDKISQKGFKTLRVPVRWDNFYFDSNYSIKEEFMNRVETVVNYGLSNNMYVIINIHHNAIQQMVSQDESTQRRVKNELSKVWTQIGNRFKNYGDKLIFETINEPRFQENWDGNPELYDILNTYNEVARSSIRSTGGNNVQRLILLPTYCASSDLKKILGWKSLSNDKMIAVSIHAYLPFNFAFDGNGHSEWNQHDEKQLSDLFENLNNCFLKKGITVVMGEFGSVNKNNIEQRIFHASKYTQKAYSLGIPCVWWDNNCFGIGAEQFGIFDRKKCDFRYGNIADAIVNTYKGIPIQNGSININTQPQHHSKPYDELFNGSAYASNWSQAISVSTIKHDGHFNCFNMTTNGCFYAEYSGKKSEAELILQSWSGGENWVKVKETESGQINGHFYSKFSYDNCVKAFGSSEFVDKLDKVYIGAKQSEITVFCLRYYFDAKSIINSTAATTAHTTNNNTTTTNSSNFVDKNSPHLSLFEGSSKSSNWGQAVSMETAKNKGKFDSSVMNPNGYFYVEYSGRQNEVEFILQSWSGGENWAKVDMSEYGQVNGHFYAKFSYEDCVDSFRSSEFTTKLDKIYVGAKNDEITVYSLFYYYK